MLFTAQDAADIEATCRDHPDLALRISRMLIMQEAMAKNAYATAAIEGSPLTEDQVAVLLRPRFRQQVYLALGGAIRSATMPR